jgi:hypothetical protein
MVWMLAGGALIVILVSGGPPIVLYPLAILSGLAVVVFLGAINSIFILLILRRDGQVAGWRQAVLPLLLGLALAMIDLAVVGLARAVLEPWLGPTL